MGGDSVFRSGHGPVRPASRIQRPTGRRSHKRGNRGRGRYDQRSSSPSATARFQPESFDRCGRGANPFPVPVRDRWDRHSGTARSEHTGSSRPTGALHPGHSPRASWVRRLCPRSSFSRDQSLGCKGRFNIANWSVRSCFENLRSFPCLNSVYKTPWRQDRLRVPRGFHFSHGAKIVAACPPNVHLPLKFRGTVLDYK